MKKILIFIAFAFVLACSSDDDNNKNLDNWRLTSHQSGLLNINSFEVNDVIWAFNFNTNVLRVTNNVSNTYPSLVPSGNYNFTFNNNIISFTSDSINYESEYEVINNTILELFFDIIPQAIDDEITYEFVKME